MTDKPGQRRLRLIKNDDLTHEIVEKGSGEFVPELREVIGGEEPSTRDDRGRINPNENPGPWEEPPPDCELFTYSELIALVEDDKGKRASREGE